MTAFEKQPRGMLARSCFSGKGNVFRWRRNNGIVSAASLRLTKAFISSKEALRRAAGQSGRRARLLGCGRQPVRQAKVGAIADPLRRRNAKALRHFVERYRVERAHPSEIVPRRGALPRPQAGFDEPRTSGLELLPLDSDISTEIEPKVVGEIADEMASHVVAKLGVAGRAVFDER